MQEPNDELQAELDSLYDKNYELQEEIQHLNNVIDSLRETQRQARDHQLHLEQHLLNKCFKEYVSDIMRNVPSSFFAEIADYFTKATLKYSKFRADHREVERVIDGYIENAVELSVRYNGNKPYIAAYLQDPKQIQIHRWKV